MGINESRETSEETVAAIQMRANGGLIHRLMAVERMGNGQIIRGYVMVC